MLNDNSASKRKGTPHSVKSTRKKTIKPKQTITASLKRRAKALLNDSSLDPQSRAIVSYGLETNDPWPPELVRRTELGQTMTETIGLLAMIQH